ncbi:MAG: TIGR00282 family metallophosphoesterase [Vampirovibrionia bacterium]
MTTTKKILFLGDIVGRPGRSAVNHFVNNIESYLDYKPDFVIANCENASHGFGLTEKNYNELITSGIDLLTSGNHIWDRKEIFSYIDNADSLIRPLNYPEGTPGKGSIVIKKDDFSLGVINILGRVFMDPYESPWAIIKDEVIKLQAQTPNVIVDFHAEATAEKIAFGYFLSELGVTAMIGTHTHVQTADESILDGVTAYITDVGSCAAKRSVIGMDINSSLKRLSSLLPARYEIPSVDEVTISGIILSVDTLTGIPVGISRLKQDINLLNLSNEDKLK